MIGQPTQAARQHHWRDRLHDPALHLSCLLVLALLAGGGGLGAALRNLAVQLFALLLLGLHGRALLQAARDLPLRTVVLLSATLLLPLVQLVPLPPALWSALPGRELATQSLLLIGRAGEWRPFSLEPSRTAIAFLSLLPVAVAMLLALRLRGPQVLLPLAVVSVIGLLSVILGAVQFSTANEIGAWYAEVQPRALNGFFANRNSSALFLLLAFVLTLALAVLLWLPGAWRYVPLGAAGLMALAVPLTGSRSGLLLLALALPAGLAIYALYAPSPLRPGRRTWRLPALAVATVLAACVLWALSYLPNIAGTLDRFDNPEEVRAEIWEDALVSGQRFWPAGSGIGTFDEVAQVDESLEHITPARSGRAHNDYLELFIESGLAGIVLCLTWIAWVVHTAWHARRGPDRVLAAASSLCLLLIGLQSFVDYPLRSQALLCIAGLAVGLLARASQSARARAASEGA